VLHIAASFGRRCSIDAGAVLDPQGGAGGLDHFARNVGRGRARVFAANFR
jgi:hypothetical protein